MFSALGHDNPNTVKGIAPNQSVFIGAVRVSVVSSDHVCLNPIDAHNFHPCLLLFVYRTFYTVDQLKPDIKNFF